MKRLFDLSVSLIGLIVLFPVLIVASVLVKTSSEGSVFFMQPRIGRCGGVFKMIKFRSMKVIQSSDSTISVKGDFRITKFGAFLRKYKIDELPQLFNVLIGDMSIVGPRPDVSGYADKLEGESVLILELRPGITGPASLKYANEEEILSLQENPVKYNHEIIYPDKVKLHLDYY